LTPKALRVLFVGLRWDYKDPKRGSSFEYTNFWDSLRRMPGVDARHFAFDDVEAAVGRDQMNKQLVNQVSNLEPDLVFFFLFENEFHASTLRSIAERTTSINWFADDHWRFATYSKKWAPFFTFVATTDKVAAERYPSVGCENVILTQWGCNHHLYAPVDIEEDLDASFVGQPHGDRRRMIDALRKQGLDVNTWGFGWPEGRLSQEAMIEVFSRSRINLNLSNASKARSLRDLARLILPMRDGKRTLELREFPSRVSEQFAKRRDQVKGRNFEIPGCGAFLLTNRIPGLDEWYREGVELEAFDDSDELLEKANYFLDNSDERRRIARAGLERTLSYHTYEKRFDDLLRAMELR
jgi:spore maturation protein CgeB